MELLAVVTGLEALKKKNQQIMIYSDSKYVVDAVTEGWLSKWLKKGFRGRNNADLWKRFWEVYQCNRVSLHWVKSHAGHLENERCDQLAVQSALQENLSVDQGYLQQRNSPR